MKQPPFYKESVIVFPLNRFVLSRRFVNGRLSQLPDRLAGWHSALLVYVEVRIEVEK